MVSCRTMCEIEDPNDLPPGTPWNLRARIRFHAWVCPHCKRFREQLQITTRVLGALPKESPDEETQSKLKAMLRARK